MTNLVDIRCSCGKLLGKVQVGAAHEHKCPRCKDMVMSAPLETSPQLDKGTLIRIEGMKDMIVIT